MDQGSGAGRSTPVAITSSVKSVIPNPPTKLKAQAHPEVSTRRPPDYRVADLFGRCFLRVCYWVDVFSSMARRGEPLAFVPFPQRAVALAAADPAKPAASAAPATPIADA
ncbi:MAG TPA: hypothetical protein VL156_10260 [Terriglobales bacterium]|jgi:hypothetical protein|nr:hypothetical protein [Terriglobales bacterium]